MFQMRLLRTLDKKTALKNHLHFHNVLIKANLLHWFGDCKRRVNKKGASSPCVYFNVEGTAYVCESHDSNFLHPCEMYGND